MEAHVDGMLLSIVVFVMHIDGVASVSALKIGKNGGGDTALQQLPTPRT